MQVKEAKKRTARGGILSGPALLPVNVAYSRRPEEILEKIKGAGCSLLHSVRNGALVGSGVREGSQNGPSWEGWPCAR